MAGRRGFEQAGGYMSYTERSSADSSPGRQSVMMSAWWSVTFPLSTLRRFERSSFLGRRHGRAKGGYRFSSADAVGISRRTHRPRGSGERYGDSSTPSSRKADWATERVLSREKRTCVRIILQGGQIGRAREALAHFLRLARRQPAPSRCGNSGEGGVCRRKGFVNAIQRWRRRVCVLYR